MSFGIQGLPTEWRRECSWNGKRPCGSDCERRRGKRGERAAASSDAAAASATVRFGQDTSGSHFDGVRRGVADRGVAASWGASAGDGGGSERAAGHAGGEERRFRGGDAGGGSGGS